MNLSPRQEAIIRLICRGKTDKQIAGELGLSVATVRGYVRILFARLGASSRAQAAFRWANR